PRPDLQGEDRGQAAATRRWIAENAKGILALSGGMSGDTGRAILAGNNQAAAAHAAYWQSVFGDAYYLEVTRCGRKNEPAWLAETVRPALQHEVPLVATNAVRFLDEADFQAHETRLAIHDGYTPADPRRPRNYTARPSLKTATQMA